MNLQEVQCEVAAHMDLIVANFKPGVKIAVFVRSPEFPERDFVMTDDDLDEVVKMIERRKSAAHGGKEG